MFAALSRKQQRVYESFIQTKVVPRYDDVLRMRRRRFFMQEKGE